MLWVSTKAFDAIAIASTTIIIIMVIIISAQALCQCTSAYTCEFQGVLRVLSTCSFEYRAIKTLKFFDQIISGKKLNRIYHFLKMPYFCWIASGPICHIDATFLTKPLQKSQFYNHEKLQRKPIFGRGLKNFHSSTLWICKFGISDKHTQQTKMFVTCQRFGDLFKTWNGLAVFFSSDKI